MSEPTNAGNNPDARSRSTEVRVRVPPRRPGLGARAQRLLGIGGLAFIGLLAIMWTWSITDANAAAGRGERAAPSATRTVTAVITGSAPRAAYVTDAAVEALARRARGTSGKLRVKTVLPAEVDEAL